MIGIIFGAYLGGGGESEGYKTSLAENIVGFFNKNY